jgi:hypothetical protein
VHRRHNFAGNVKPAAFAAGVEVVVVFWGVVKSFFPRQCRQGDKNEQMDLLCFPTKGVIKRVRPVGVNDLRLLSCLIMS